MGINVHPLHSRYPFLYIPHPVTMFAARQATNSVFRGVQRRAFSQTAANASKVAVLGSAGGIGQPLSLLLKLNPRVSELALYDIKGGPGVAADIGHINTKSNVKGYEATPEGVKECVKAAAESCPDANMLIISNPVNSTVPITAEVFKSRGVYNPKKLFGVTTLDVVRASRFISQLKNTDPANENIPVVGGHSGATIVPLLSQSGYELQGAERDEYIKRVQFGGDEVVQAKGGAGSATLSMAMAGARFAESLLKAAQGQKNVVEPTFVDSPLYKDQGVPYFASQVTLGANGVEEIHPVGKVTEFEQGLLEVCLKDLKANIEKGEKWAKENP